MASEPNVLAEPAQSPPTSQPNLAERIFSNKIVVGYTGLASSIINTNGVFNLSSHVLTEVELTLLSKGLSFSPTPGDLNLSNVRQAVESFHRSLHLAHHFHEIDGLPPRNEDEGFGHPNFRPRSKWVPPVAPPAPMSAFFTANYAALNKLPRLRSNRRNISNAEMAAIKSLNSNRKIIMKSADKGSGIVLMNVQDYIYEANRQLSDTAFYEPANLPDLDKAVHLVENLLTAMRNDKEIDQKCFDYLWPDTPVPGRFYMLPKIHKGKLPPPGRPIISAIGSPTEKISEFLDFFLQPYLATIPSYVKDTGHFLHLINNLGILPKNTILVTYDVTSLYTNIPLPEAERAIARVLLRNRPSATAPTNSSLLKMLRLIFSHNIFTFSDGKGLHYYLQTSGVSMGSRCAPAVACTYMAEFERLYIHDRTDLPYKPLLWLRFIDDIFCLWPHGETCLHEFTNYLNSRHPRIKFTCSFSTDSVEFLDTKVYLEDNTLKTSLFIKPTSSLAYLQRTSCHPIHVFLSLPYGEFLRTRRNSTDYSSYDHSAKIILDAFVDRGYDAATLTQAMLKARETPRSYFLDRYTTGQGNQQSSPPADFPRQFYLVLQYHARTRQVRDIIRSNWGLLSTSYTTKWIHDSKLIMGYRRNPNLKDLLVKSTIPLPSTHGKTGKKTNTCDKLDCIYCASLNKTGKIHSKTLNSVFTSKYNVTCQSHNIVYCLTCKTCGLQYVGMTKRKFQERLREHFRNIRNANVRDPIGKHFDLPGHHNDPKNVESHILSFITKPGNTKAALTMRLKFELQWIFRLRTSLPHGLNSMD